MSSGIPLFMKLKMSLLQFPSCLHSLEKVTIPFSALFTCKHTTSVYCSHGGLSGEMSKITPVHPMSDCQLCWG